ncbi:MAG: biotin--[acetyl-CoA-carboxylase] ligase [Methanomicrobiales archaeon]|jgi:BirA family biotin operon repressor/biotin-[acetyl-CoA-carboxylase] ligase
MDDPAFDVLRVLDEGGGSAPADTITASLGIPRSRVTEAVDRLRALGYAIAEPRKDLYQLTKRSGRLLPYEIQKHLGTKFIGRRMKYLETTESTTWIARDLACRQDPAQLHGTMVIAEEQTGGQGRLGRAWASPPGGIWTTIILAPKIPIDRVFMVTMAAAIAVARAVRKDLDLGALIKWPNDIFIGDKKVAGLLLELSAENAVVNYTLLGLGIDANISIARLDPGLRAAVTSLSAELGREVDRPAFLATVLREFERHYELLEAGEYEAIVREWRSLSLTLGHRVRITTLAKTFEGEAVDIDEFGALLVRKETGAVERVIAGDCRHI